DILHIPISVTGINFVYNIPEKGFGLYDEPVYLTADLITEILLGVITNWNDPKISELNKKISANPTRIFPNLPITIIKRNNPSSDTYLLTTFLSKASKIWNNKIGVTNLLNAIGGVGQPSALDIVKNIIEVPGAFGYSTMIYGIQNNLPLIRVKNYFGTYVRGCNFRSAEAMKALTPKPDNRVDLTYPNTNPEAAVAAGFNYILIKKDLFYNENSEAKAQTLVNFIAWLLSPEAQQQLDPIFFSPLTPQFRVSSKQSISKITYNKKQIIPQELIKKNK
ncbi:MAG: substrate-binding domain-containing protein, partial [Brevinema sp.]